MNQIKQMMESALVRLRQYRPDEMVVVRFHARQFKNEPPTFAWEVYDGSKHFEGATLVAALSQVQSPEALKADRIVALEKELSELKGVA